MDANFTFKNIKSSQELTAYASKKLKKIDKYRDLKFLDSKYIFSTEKDNSIHIAELIVQIKNDTISAVAKEKNMYQAVDEVVVKIARQLEKKKTNFKHKRHEHTNF